MKEVLLVYPDKTLIQEIEEGKEIESYLETINLTNKVKSIVISTEGYTVYLEREIN
jgi:hypothetical protein